MSETAVVVLNYNGLEFLKKFIPILLKYTAEPTEIYIADNCSTDQSFNFLKGNFPTIHHILLEKNLGFAEGYNQALKQINSKYYVLLNSDVEVTIGWLEPLINALKTKNIAACQPKILSYYNKSVFEYAGAAGGYIDWLGYPFCRGRIINKIEKDLGQYNDSVPIFWASGACLAINAKVFHRLEGFDGGFFAHMEEIDLCWRIQNAGYSIQYVPDSKVYHVGGGTLPKTNAFKTFLNFRNGLAMVYKNSPAKGLIVAILVRLMFDGIAALTYLPKGEFSNFIAVIRAHFAFYSQLSILRKKRIKIISEIKVGIKLPTIYSKSIILEYMINGKRKFTDLSWKILN